MAKIFLIILTGICTSLFIYPFNPSILPAANTKMVLAVIGLATLGYSLSTKREALFDKQIFILSIFALLVSFVGFISMCYNETPDTTYASYVMSMWVWLGAAYLVTKVIHFTHGHISVELICYYLIAVSTAQTILAITIDNVPAVKNLVDAMMVGEGFMGANDSRLYGLGCALDVAGSRFAATLVMIAFLIPREMQKTGNKLVITLLFLCLGTITIIGNMMARTTILGVAVAFLYLFYATCYTKGFSRAIRVQIMQYTCIYILLFSSATALAYKTNSQMRENIRFAFEGFFSLVEKGYWETNSNNILQNMVKWPDNDKTWIIGDGYFDNPEKQDPHYTGPQNRTAFYQGTDIGYCRFIFYFGIVGLLTFSAFIIRAALTCANRLPQYRYLFLWIMALNFIVWSKVASDMFMVLAPFLCIAASDQEEYENSLEANEQAEVY